MKYRRKNKLSFNKINFKKFQFKNKKNLFVIMGILIILLLFFLISKLINKNTVVIKNEDKPKMKKIQIVDPVFLEKLDVKIYKVDLEKEYGINLNKSNEKTIKKDAKPIINKDNKILEIEVIPKNKDISQWKENDLILENIFSHEDSINIEN